MLARLHSGVFVLLMLVVTAPSLPAQQAPQALARELLKEMTETDTTGEHGDTTPLAEALARRFRQAGFPAEDVQVVGPEARHRNLIVRLRGSGQARPILIISHLDVVEARPEDWTVPPFKLTEKEGWLYGRGTQDIKGEAAIEAATLLQLKQEGFVPKRDLILALTTGEEGATFYNGIDWLLTHRRDLIDAEYCLNGDGGGPRSDKGRPVFRALQSSEKSYYNFALTVTDPGGHSSLPHPGTAIQVLAQGLARLETWQPAARLDETTRAFFHRMASIERGETSALMAKAAQGDPAAIAALSQDPNWNAQLRTTLVTTMIQGGHATNALPQRATATVNCRLLPADDILEIQRQFTNVLAEPRIQVKLLGKPHTSPASPLREDVVGAVERSTHALWPDCAVVPTMETGATDGALLRRSGLPTYGIGCIPVDRDDVREHGQDERIRVKDFEAGVKAFGLLVRELAK
ncbi:MAG TPA: M20/M25/M40 family metallo-hydrolase [Bacillota bacterium]|nr:M20/M25/M40 family metallo-hydrolase [Bacillota bacterium]